MGKKKKSESSINDTVSAIRAVTTLNILLSQGAFKYGYTQMLTQSFEFLGSLHSQLTAEALAHPDADSIPELVEIKKSLEVKSDEQAS